MKISKALKLKNRLAGEIGRLKELIQTRNVVKNGVEREHDIAKSLTDLDKVVMDLVSVKTAIALGNSGKTATKEAIEASNHRAIFAMAEIKGLIEFYKSIPTTHGEITEGSYMRGDPIKATYDAVIRAKNVEQAIKKLQGEIDSLQDAVDAHNAMTDLPGIDGIAI